MVNYKCASCGAKLDMDLEVLGLTCRVCGEKIFYKIRPSTKKPSYLINESSSESQNWKKYKGYC